MEKLFFCLMLVFMAKAMQAQDTLFFKNGAIVLAEVQETDEQSVRYKRIDNMDGTLYSANKTDVSHIIFKNGTREEGTAAPKQLVSSQFYLPQGVDADGLYKKGVEDARIHYTHPCGAVGTGICTVALGVLGLVPAIICSATPPKEKNLGYPDVRYWQLASYKQGYKHEAHKIKKHRVWKGFGVGIGTLVAAGLVVYFISG